MTLKADIKDREFEKFVEPSTGVTAVRTLNVGSLIPEDYDYISITYTGTNPTSIVYKTGGVGGSTVATLTITFDGNNNPLTIARS